jgi:diacylglycerol kinase family enzyme
VGEPSGAAGPASQTGPGARRSHAARPGDTARPGDAAAPAKPTASERVSAAASFAFLVVALTLLGLNLALRIGAFALALAGLLVGVTACWYAVSRRGLIRTLAVIGAVIGLGAFLAGLVLAIIKLWIAFAVVAAAVLSVLCAQYALRRTPKALRSRNRAAAKHATPGAGVTGGDRTPDAETDEVAATGQRPPAGFAGRARPEHVLIMNLRSGGGKAERFGLADECRSRGIEPIVLKPGNDLTTLAERAIAGGATAIGMAGGDGSQALVAAVAARQEVPHVCVPAGTRNHFALDLGLDRDDVTGALDAYADQIEQRVDLAFVSGHPFVNNCSLGLYAKVVQSPEYRDAKMRTAVDMLPDLLGPDAQPMDLRYQGPDGTACTTAHLILVSNDPYQLASPGGRGTRERLDLGLLGIVAVRVASADEMRRFTAAELTGQLHRFAGWQEWAAEEFEVDSGGPVEVGVDGEAMVLDPPLRFIVRPAALRVWLPASAVRASPAARAVRLLTRSTAADLAKVAAGGRAAPAA